MAEQQDMTGRVVLVTGGGSGLGHATCRELAGAGAHVLVADVDSANAERTAKEITAEGGLADALTVDVTDASAVDRVFDEAFATHGSALDCLVNNAGTDRGADITDVTDSQWHSVFDVNVHGPMYTSRAFIQRVLSQGGRNRPVDIVNIVSISALTVGSGAGAYNASKAALLKLSEVLQTESRERGWPVRVCAIHPAAMDTPMMDQWGLPPERMMNPAVVAGLVRTAATLDPSAVLQSLVVTGRTEYFPR